MLSMGRREEACHRYAQGDITLREAASIANVTVREMLDPLKERGISGNVTLEQQRKAIDETREAQEDG